MRKASFLWLVVGLVLGAGTVLLGVGWRHSSSSALTASEAETVAEVQELIGDLMPLETGSGDNPLASVPLVTPSQPTPSAFDAICQELAAAEANPGHERLHYPKLIEVDESHVSTAPAAPPAALDGDSIAIPYTGSHSCTLEKLGKVQLPHGIYQQLKSPALLFVRAGADGCIEVYPPLDLERDAAGRKLDEEAARRQRRLWYSRMTALRLEPGGGFTLPEEFIQSADLDGYLVIIGVGDHFEIWDAQRWQEYVNQDGQPTTDSSPEVSRPRGGVPSAWSGILKAGFFQ
jgi:MraZ protein